jgi:short-subunit dehydrogenase
MVSTSPEAIGARGDGRRRGRHGSRMRDARSILITGASSGIGAALARSYAAPGVRLALGGRNADRLATVAALCRSSGAEVATSHFDVTDGPAVTSFVVGADDERPLDLVIANAGMTGGSDGIEPIAEIERMMRVNFAGACAAAHAAIPQMCRRRRGQIALMSSLAALRGLPYSPSYCASKAAVKAYGESLRGLLRSDGVEVSVILPGFVDTPLSQHIDGPKPLMMTADHAARIIRRGLERNRARIAFPALLHLAARLAAALPAALVDPVLTSVPVKIRRYE